MGDRRCCCGCFTFTDEFTRVDSTDVGENWNEVVGDWGIESDRLVEKYGTSDGTADALIICKVPVPERSKGEMHITIKVPASDLTVSRTYWLYPACIDDHTIGPIAVSYYWNSATSKWTTSIMQTSDWTSLDSYEVSVTGTPSEFTLVACADHELGLVKAYVTNTINPLAAWALADPGEGRYAGIGHDHSDDLNHFDDFTLAELRTSTEVCVSCFCMCEDTATRPTMTATIVDATDRASCLNGLSWDMDFFQGPQAVTWRGSLVVNEGEVTEETLNYELTCPGNGSAESFTLRWLEPWNCATAAGTEPANALRTANAESTCVPLYLLFGPYVLSFTFNCDLCYSIMEPGCVIPPPGVNCSGEFYIAITI